MNTVSVSGFIQGAPELRVTKDGRRILNFEVAVEGPGREPFCPIAKFIAPDENLTLEAGERVLVVGALRHHRQRGIFIGADRIYILRREEQQRSSGQPASSRLDPLVRITACASEPTST